MKAGQSIFDKTPPRIASSTISFLRIDPLAWAYVMQMSAADRAAMSGLLGAKQAYGDCFTNRADYQNLCDGLTRRETNGTATAARARYYFTHNLSDGIVGFAQLQIPDTNRNVIGLGYAILPRHQNRGLATQSVSVMAGTLLAMRITDNVCSEVPTTPHNPASERVLIKAGFRDAAHGPVRSPIILFIGIKRSIAL